MQPDETFIWHTHSTLTFRAWRTNGKLEAELTNVECPNNDEVAEVKSVVKQVGPAAFLQKLYPDDDIADAWKQALTKLVDPTTFSLFGRTVEWKKKEDTLWWTTFKLTRFAINSPLHCSVDNNGNIIDSSILPYLASPNVTNVPSEHPHPTKNSAEFPSPRSPIDRNPMTIETPPHKLCEPNR